MRGYIFEQHFTGSHVRPAGHEYKFNDVPKERREELQAIGKTTIAPLFDKSIELLQNILAELHAALVMGDYDVWAWRFKYAEPAESLKPIAEALAPYTHGEIAWILSGIR